MAKGQQQEEVPWRLIMLLGGRRFEEMIAAEIIANKKGICARKITSDDTITFGSPQAHQSF